jgi:hypothetical protein
MNSSTKNSPIETLAFLAKMLDNNDAVITISTKILDNDTLNTEVTLHESMNLPDESQQLKSLYFISLGSMIGAVMERYPIQEILGYISDFVKLEIGGKDQQRH